MPEPTVPRPQPPQPSITIVMTDLAHAHANATLDTHTRECIVSLGSVHHRVVLTDTTDVLAMLFADGLAQIEAIAGR